MKHLNVLAIANTSHYILVCKIKNKPLALIFQIK